MASPNKLTLWEAQFGDFANSAQVIIDQFLTCSAFKWQRFSGLVLLLPHGYEGQGPEHSSARLERFLTACAQNNIQVCNVTTPAQYFHLLRRQVKRGFRLPLIVMTPKSLLRHPLAVSPLVDFTEGCFNELLDEPNTDLKKTATRLVIASGKIYYELLEARNAGNKPVALVRAEQFYPFSKTRWMELFASYPRVEEVVWCQEGPQNMEGWVFMSALFEPLLKSSQRLIYAGRAPQASPADSYLQLHLKEQRRIVAEALG